MWKQPKCPSIDKWIKKDVVCIHTQKTHNGLLLRHKKEWNFATCDNMAGLLPSEKSQREKDKHCMISLTCGN